MRTYSDDLKDARALRDEAKRKGVSRGSASAFEAAAKRLDAAATRKIRKLGGRGPRKSGSTGKFLA